MIGIILAGGLASRMGGGDKGLRAVGGVPILDRVVATMRAQCDHLIINANGAADRLGAYGLPIVSDDLADHPGPLAGVLAGLDWVAVHHPGVSFAVTAPTDTPFLPHDLVSRLQDKRVEDRAAIVCARSGGSTHPVAALWSVDLRHDLRRALTDEGLRKVGHFLERHPLGYVDWPVEPYDPFFNANVPDDLAEAEMIVARYGDCLRRNANA